MRTNFSHFLLQLTAILGLTAIAFAQTELATERQDVVVDQESNYTPKANAASSGILKKFEDWVGLTNTKLEDLAAMAERLQVEIAKMKTQHSEAASAITKPAPALSPLLNNPVDLRLPQNTHTTNTHTTTQAEIDKNDSFDLVVAEVGETAPLPVLNSNTPEWVKNGLVLGDEHSLAISSNLFSDLEQCREDLKARMMADVQTYLDKHVLKSASADQLPELTEEYVEKHWVKKGQEFDNIQDRPSGVYHQLWIGLHISSEQLAKVHKWEKQCVRVMRTKKVGCLGGVSVIAISLLSGAVGVLARREKAKLRG
ncbi:MAG TPA: hypothetical protein VM260_01200 [Pirellula sp.]|nr:hypothetical protein [Pirellula sp.]